MLEGFVPYPQEYVKKYREKGYWEDQTIAARFTEACQQYSDRVAVCDAHTEVTYTALLKRSQQVALNLLDAGIQPGDIVVLQLGNVLEFIYLYFAFQMIGVRPILALLNHRYRELRQFVELSGAVAIFTHDKAKDCSFIDIVNRIESETSTLKNKFVLGETAKGFHSIDEIITATSVRDLCELDEIQRAIDPCEPALFLLSGGTTGIPKLIPRTHNDFICNSKLATEYTGIDDNSVMLIVLQMAHNLPLACPGLQGFIRKGAKIVLHTSIRPEEVFELVQKHKVTHIHVVPAILIKWMHDEHINDYDLSSIEVIQSGGQSLQPETRLLTEKMLPECTVQENFGMAEGLLMFVHLDDPREVRLETVGRPVCDDDEVKLVDDDGREVAKGEVGEMWCRGPYTLRGYFRAEEHNKKGFSDDGFFHSGDLMRQHSSGNYIVEGRKKDLINRAGEKISAEEVENLILSHEAVKNVACVAMPDPITGEKMCAYVILQPEKELSFGELSDYLLSHEMAKFKLPERLEIVDEFPLSNFGKVSKKDLVVMITEKLQQEGNE
ncbi:MAG: AMP-binding protein [Coxiellaceae bacterium]|nr:AMP-binding protein [Coxiellaceae bacterium]